MPKILCIETTTSVCSIAIELDGVIIDKNILDGQRHSEVITVLIQEMLAEFSLSMGDLDAVAVSMGPGSYTGLRVGYSAAKALCYGLDIPFITIDTLEALAYNYIGSGSTIIPMIDARRLEVYCAVYSEDGNCIIDTQTLILDGPNILEKFGFDNIILCGDGSVKAEIYFNKKQIVMGTPISLAKYLVPLAVKKYNLNDFADIAYAVPHYFKSPNITKSKKNILGI